MQRDDRAMHADAQPAPVATLLENHRAFLQYLERRVGDRALAEDILQDAFAKVVARPEQAPTDEAIVPWFYRTLRNAAVDQFRRRGAADRAYEAFARELESHETPTTDVESEICACVSRLATTLKARIRGGASSHRDRGHSRQGVCRAEGVVIEQRRRAGFPCTAGTEKASRRILWDMCRAWMRELHVQELIVAGTRTSFRWCSTPRSSLSLGSASAAE